MRDYGPQNLPSLILLRFLVSPEAIDAPPAWTRNALKELLDVCRTRTRKPNLQDVEQDEVKTKSPGLDAVYSSR